MEPWEDDEAARRWMSVRDNLCEWVASARRDSSCMAVSYDHRASQVWLCEDNSLVKDISDVALIVGDIVGKFRLNHVDLDAWLLHGRFTTLMVIKVEGIVLGLHMEVDFEEGEEVGLHVLHVRVLDHVPDIYVTVSPETGEMDEDIDDFGHMGWEITMPSRRQVMDVIRNVCHSAGMCREEPRVHRMDSLSVVFESCAKSDRAYAYHYFIDWLTPQVGIDAHGEPWDKKTTLRVEDADGTPENQAVVRTVLLKHPSVRDKLTLKTTEWDGLPSWVVALHAYSDTGSIDTTINQPTQAQITEIITRWWRLGETITKNQETATDGH